MTCQVIGLKDLFNIMPTRVIFSISSDFGLALAEDWLNKGYDVAGTYRTFTDKLDILAKKGVKLVMCDTSNSKSIDEACAQLSVNLWDVLCIAPASLDPVGDFVKVDINEWESSIYLNFTSQMRIIHQMLPARDLECNNGPVVILFAGGGTNNATTKYSAYTVSKIAQIKMTELLDAEILDSRFSIIGPGWIKTKIHESTLKAGEQLAGDNYQKTIDKLNETSYVPIQKVVECCNWVIGSERQVVSGRNISLVFDKWGSYELDVELKEDPNMYKLRRYGNKLI